MRLGCDKKYIRLICEGKKTVEGRVNDPKYQNVKPGDLVQLVDKSNPDCNALCMVRGVNRYKTFDDMLDREGVSNCTPGTSLEEALKIYRSFPGYDVGERKYGAVAFLLEVLDQGAVDPQVPRR